MAPWKQPSASANKTKQQTRHGRPAAKEQLHNKCFYVSSMGINIGGSLPNGKEAQPSLKRYNKRYEHWQDKTTMSTTNNNDY
jgi:hypothetical protein